jgi:hypothetical protein
MIWLTLAAAVFAAPPAGAHKRTPAPPVGAEAPDFELAKLGSDETVRLSSFEGDRPVALVFGSYT